MFSISVDPKKVIKDGIHYSFPKSSYWISYKEFVAYFKSISVIEEHNLIIGINFTYGWMPTIFEFKSDQFTQATSLLNMAKSGKLLSAAELLLLKSIFNNSLVGTSKILHFINPEIYAIWDSKVYYYLTSQKPYKSRIESPNAYLLYLRWIKNVIVSEGYSKMKQRIEALVGYTMSDNRIVELVLFSSNQAH